MQKEIHPMYNKEVEVQCICGNKFNINSVSKGPIKVESCPACHPTYTGKQETRVVKGRMEKFLEKKKRMESIKSKK
ncbi:50S ribosomal protein L31 [Candidatus Vampirococcus lugosii]|uniref:50S ribosomal protein L31 n=1 Tax=Candidatus Vampirococcus lugosii TaxID=2789015 RepID=A0ABS5QJW7_9BACT|nr:50S ribosomal protein L31 [Candidatus Vampirococcus lugosii]MBS8121561.1 Ribosomal protein L31 [Candidatus Vampirococcus lugosii]